MNTPVNEWPDGRQSYDPHDTTVAPDDSGQGYCPTRRNPRKHKRVVFHGTELFDADGVKLEPGDTRTAQQREADDDRRILGELPPHWGIFSERE